MFLFLTIVNGTTTICALATKGKVGATKVQKMLKRMRTRKFNKVGQYLTKKENDALRKICCGRFRWNLGSADLKNIMGLNESYIVVG